MQDLGLSFENDINQIWFVKSGRNSIKFNEFKKNDFVGIRWNLGDLSAKNTLEIKSICEKEFSAMNKQVISNRAFQLDTFVNNINVGDYIISSHNSNNEFILGVITSEYYFSINKDNSIGDSQFTNCRDVKWLCTIKKENISSEVRNSFPSDMDVFEVIGNAKEEFLEFYNDISYVNDEKRNIIYFGAPGTGKSHKLNKKKDKLLENYQDNYERVTFHPDYNYANFVGTYKPISTDEGEMSFKYVSGPFMRILVKALKNPSQPFVLIIEEINRANVAAVFGDIFQLLDRENNVSQYPIHASEDMKKYLKEELDNFENSDVIKCILKKYWISLLGSDYEKIRIPSNMFIWATMNSADQGVFSMDTAFKRRWDFKYIDINEGKSELKDIKVLLNDNIFSWNEIREAINNELISYKINEDKLMGPFFAFKNLDENLSPSDLKKEFKEIFKNKIIMYLFEDVARAKRSELFHGTSTRFKNKNVTYYQIRNDFEKNELKIFSDKIQEKLKLVNR